MDALLWHDPSPPFAYPLHDERIRVRLRMAHGDNRIPIVEWCDRTGWVGPNEEAPMRWLCDDGTYCYWEADVRPQEGRVRYIFRLEAERPGTTPTWFGELGALPERPHPSWPDGYFHWPYLHSQRLLDVPAWVRDAICYEIFPDRFARGKPPVLSPTLRRWHGHPTHNSIWGGDLRGVADAAGYVESLGVNLLWLTPIFESPSNHRYDTTDYGRIDHRLGDEELFARLVSEYRRRGIRIVLDGVFNHSGAQFAPWRDVLERGFESPYWSWFDVHDPQVDRRIRNYRSFAHVAHMPRLMTGNPEVQAYLMEHATHWMRMGIAGWRLDVADEVDMAFWREFRREMRAITPDAYFVGEIAYNAARWLEGDQFDGVMNYPLRSALQQFIVPQSSERGKGLDAQAFLHMLARLRAWHPGWAATAALNPLSTHDVPRFLTLCGGDVGQWRLAMLLLFSLEGIPLIYYGDEVGLQGGNDPDCRRPMVWESAEQNGAMLATTKQLVQLRREQPALRASGLYPLTSGSPNVAAFLRGTTGYEEVSPGSCPEDAVALVVVNRGHSPVTIDLALSCSECRGLPVWPMEKQHAVDMLTAQRHALDAGRLKTIVPPCQGLVLVPEP